MSRLFKGSINVSKIDKTKLFKGEKGSYLDVTIWLNNQEDKYGQIASIEQTTDKGADKIFIGNLKEFKLQIEPKQDAPETDPFA